MFTADQFAALGLEIADLRIRLENTVEQANAEVARLQAELDARPEIEPASSEPDRPVVSVLSDSGSEASH